MDLGKSKLLVSTHSRLKAAGKMYYIDNNLAVVSTHSRLKAAGGRSGNTSTCTHGFNTQPPEGGWKTEEKVQKAGMVSTHSRLKAAGCAAI